MCSTMYGLADRLMPLYANLNEEGSRALRGQKRASMEIDGYVIELPAAAQLRNCLGYIADSHLLDGIGSTTTISY